MRARGGDGCCWLTACSRVSVHKMVSSAQYRHKPLHRLTCPNPFAILSLSGPPPPPRRPHARVAPLHHTPRARRMQSAAASAKKVTLRAPSLAPRVRDRLERVTTEAVCDLPPWLLALRANPEETALVDSMNDNSTMGGRNEPAGAACEQEPETGGVTLLHRRTPAHTHTHGVALLWCMTTSTV